MSFGTSGRTESACTKRWHHAFSRTVEGGSGLWTAEEDEILLSNVMERRARGVRVDWASFPALLPGQYLPPEQSHKPANLG